MKKLSWTIGDILDLEYFLDRNAQAGDESLINKRDRELFLHHIRPELGLKASDNPGVHRREMIKLWLSRIRQDHLLETNNQSRLPGDCFKETLLMLNYCFFFAGVLIGISVCASFFTYTGSQPLNISYYLAVTVLVQICLLILLSGTFVLGIRARLQDGSWVPYAFLASFVEKMILRMNRHLFNTLSVERRQSVVSALGLLKSGHIVYGFLFFWPLFILMQLFSVGFNVGVLLSTFFRILFFDTAFGWQSTVQLSSDLVYKLVSTLALPWSWIIPEGIGFPTMEQIQGTRMILKDGILHLTTENLVSWWPFLCLAVLCYGLLPRLILVFSGYWAMTKSLVAIKFDHGSCDRLVRRFLTPLVSTESSESQAGEGPVLTDDFQFAKQPTEQHDSIVLVPDDIYDSCLPDQLDRMIHAAFGCSVKGMERIGLDFDADIKLIETLFQHRSADNLRVGSPGIILLQEAWQPPIREVMVLIEKLRASADKKTPVMVALIGRPGPDTIFTKIDPSDYTVWNRKIAGIGDPYLHLEPLVTV